jgi:hypothetical protein
MQDIKFKRPTWIYPVGLFFYTNKLHLIAVALLIIIGLSILSCAGPDYKIESISSSEQPAIIKHASNEDIATGSLKLEELLAIGEQIFNASFNTLDGAGNSKTRLLPNQSELSQINSRFNRISGPDANSCLGCHNLPSSGGGGDNVANVFVLAHEFPNANFDQGAGDKYEKNRLSDIGNERGTISMFGSGLIELLAKEMTIDLHNIRDKAKEQAVLEGSPITLQATSKGISFGSLTAWPDGLVDNSKIEGIDEDLVVRPFSQKGVYVSIREFTLDSLNLHHGIQAEERFGSDVDADLDGVHNELTIADTTALILFQASLRAPHFAEPESESDKAKVMEGDRLFSEIGCAVCHKPYLELNSPIFSEPNPFNPSGTLSDYYIPEVYSIDLAKLSKSNAIKKTDAGTFQIYAYTDLKRHDMGPLLSNEKREQRFVDPSHWLTKKLWGMMSEPPFLHHGRATLLGEAIDMHLGEANSSRLKYDNLSEHEQSAIITFMHTFRTE